MKLQKLLYYAHGWCLALQNEPLLVDKFEKWTYGPVVPSIYYEFRDYGARPISAIGTRPENGTLPARPIVKRSDVWTWDLIRKICEEYGRLDGIQLSIMSHSENGAWAKTKGNNAEIDDDLIKTEIEENHLV
ncbi:Panacea domain-containing protein [Pigmentiphaga litoralis]|uniref:Panacea domain-containing protein n=1 Tax=Pigmentiphaga litoralis TaxID=516702 RepID=UPI003B42E2F2